MIWVNGIATDVLPVSDRGLQYGDGVWETIAIRNGVALQLDAHLARLQRGLDALAIEGLDIDLLKAEINDCLPLKQQVILKIIITRGSGGRGYGSLNCYQPTRILSLHDWPEYPDDYSKNGVKVTLCETRLSQNPLLAGFKHLNRLEQVLARAEFTDEFQEGLVRDTEGHMIEGTMSNLFVVKQDGQMVTPNLKMCGIEGIARLCIIEELYEMGIRLDITQVGLNDVIEAQGLFLSNSVIKLWPVRQFQNISYAIPESVRILQSRIQGRL